MAKILIVDDHVINREMLMVALDQGEHQLLEAGDGVQALKLLKAEHPDLVITDILMPKMDGYEFVSRLREDPTTAATPVIFYTATYRASEANAMALACGVQWTLAKPSQPDVILRTVQEALGHANLLAPSHLELASNEDSRFPGIEQQLAKSTAELQSSLELVSRVLGKAQESPDGKNLDDTVQRLSTLLSNLQSMSLRLTALIELGIELSAERDPARLTVAGSRLAQNICVAKYAFVGLFENNPHQLEYFATSGLDVASEARLGTPDPRAGILGTLLEGHVAYRRNGLDGNPVALGLPPTHPPIHSFLGAPIASRERTYGWIYLVDKLGTEEFTEMDERVAATVADQIAISYENLIIEAESQQAHLKMAREYSESLRLNEDLRRFRSAMDACADALILVNRATVSVIDCNETACRLLGYDKTEILQPEDSNATVVRLIESLAGNGEETGPEKLQLQSGTGATIKLEVLRRTYRSSGEGMIVVSARDLGSRKSPRRD